MGSWAAPRPHIALEFSAGGGKLRVRVLERPGLWLEKPELDRLVEEVRTVVRSLRVGDLSYGILTGEKRHLDRLILTLIEDRKTGAPVAFNAMFALDCTLRGSPVDVIHLGLTAVDPRFRSRGVAWILTGFTTFLLFVKNGLRPYWISNVSQVPAAIGMVAEAAANVYPSPDPAARRSFDHVVLAREIMGRHRDAFGVGEDAVFDTERFVILNAYTGGSDHLKKRWEDAPRHRDERFNELCRKALDYERGDDFLQIGQWGLKTTHIYFLRMAPQISPLRLTLQFAFLALESSVAPLLQWLKPQVAMGDIRPRRVARP